MSETDCPCNSGNPFELCCEPYLLGRLPAPTAEALMRSRYTAYALCSVDYLYRTSGKRVRKEFDSDGTQHWAKSAEWIGGIEILHTEGGGRDDEKGSIEFIAHYTVKDVPQHHHEKATFAKNDGEWFFIDGEIVGHEPERRETPKIGRNDPCTCGSGRKYKKCCGAIKA